MAQQAEARLRAAEGQILGLQHELAVVEAELGGRDAQIQELGAQIEAFAHDPGRSTPNMLAKELDSILSSAQETAAHMIERAKAVSGRHLEQASEFQRELHEDLARIDEWRQAALPLIRAVQSRMAEIQATLLEVAERVAETVKPLEQLPDIDRSAAAQLDLPLDESSGEGRPPWTKLGPGEEQVGKGIRPKQRSARTRSPKGGSGASSDVIEIPDQVRAR